MSTVKPEPGHGKGTDAAESRTPKRKRVIDSDDEEENALKKTKTETGAKPKPAIVKTPIPARKAAPPAKKATPAKKASPAKKATPAKKGSPAKKATNKRKRSSSSSSESSSEESSSEESSSEESSSEESSSEESSPKKKKATPKKSPVKKVTPKKDPKKEKDTKKSPRKVKDESDDEKPKKKKAKKEEEGEGWWDNFDESWKTGDKATWKWRTLEHNGVLFPPPYVPHKVQMLYNGEKVKLTPDQEEAATFFARYMETEHIKKPQFSKNFFHGFKTLLGKDHVIKEFSKCDFTPILNHLKAEKEVKKNRTKEEKEKEKKEKADAKEKYGYAMIDGRREALGNFTVEPPGLFLGRGDHPKAGMLKTRTHPKDVVLNLTEGVKPPLAQDGSKYGGVINNHEVAWVAYWRQNISDTPKYVLFAATSSLRGKSDQKKFDKAKELGKNIAKIRKTYTEELTSKTSLVQQRATALWIIDHLALRVGGAKGEDEADTVGCCSLRFEHMKLHEPLDVEFDFLGKDSMRYQNRVSVDKQVFKNLKGFLKGKKKGDDIFDELTPTVLNAHLKSLMKGLTAKVFRTYNASICMQKQLDNWDEKKNKNASAEEKLLYFNASSVEVAILCNHKRTVAQTFTEQMGKLDLVIVDTKEEIRLIKEHKKALKSGKSPKKKKDGEDEIKLPSSVEACDKKIELLQQRIKKTELKKTDKDQQKEISTSTSKVNYIDPRISITWCNKVGLDIAKIFPKTLRDKFGWAVAEVKKKPDFRF